MKTVYECEGCGRTFPNPRIIKICEERHAARKAAYEQMVEEASKILAKPSYESWPQNPPGDGVPRGIKICRTKTGREYFWWKSRDPATGSELGVWWKSRDPATGSELGVGGADIDDAALDTTALDAAWDRWIALSREEDAPFELTDGALLRLPRPG